MGSLMGTKQKRPKRGVFSDVLAEKEGFEPSIRRTVYRISSPAHSTTLPPLQVVLNEP